MGATASSLTSTNATTDSNPMQDLGQPNKPKKDGITGGGELQEEEEEEEGECEFCLFMKMGGCKEDFTAFEECVDEAEKKGKEIDEMCVEVTKKLIKCMEAHHDYYKHYFLAKKAKEAELAAKAKAGVSEI